MVRNANRKEPQNNANSSSENMSDAVRDAQQKQMPLPNQEQSESNNRANNQSYVAYSQGYSVPSAQYYSQQVPQQAFTTPLPSDPSYMYYAQGNQPQQFAQHYVVQPSQVPQMSQQSTQQVPQATQMTLQMPQMAKQMPQMAQQVPQQAISPVLLGTYTPKIDGKGRVALPAKFRAQLGTGFVMAKGQERCVYVLPMQEFQRITAQIQRTSMSNKSARDYLRVFLSGAVDQEPDKQGRIVVPPMLREYANLGDEIVVIGVGTRAEIWNKTAWNEYLADREQGYSDIADDVLPVVM